MTGIYSAFGIADRNLPDLGVLKEVEAGNITGDDIICSILSISRQAEVQMGGTSGALYS